MDTGFFLLPFQAVKRYLDDVQYKKQNLVSRRSMRGEDIGRDLTLSTAVLTTVVSVVASVVIITVLTKRK